MPVSASAVKPNGDYIHTPIGKQSYETPRALETEEIPPIVEDYRLAAERAKDAGFDGVEIHAANGYLIDQFLQSKTNQRTGQIGVRLSPNGVFNDMGCPEYRELFIYVAQQLNSYNLAYLYLLDGLGFGFHELGDSMTLAEFRTVFDGVLMGNCGYTQESAEETIKTGNADLIAFGRPFISNPDLVERFSNDWPLNPPADMNIW